MESAFLGGADRAAVRISARLVNLGLPNMVEFDLTANKGTPENGAGPTLDRAGATARQKSHLIWGAYDLSEGTG